MTRLLGLVRQAVADAVDDRTGANLSGGIDSSTITTLALEINPDMPVFTGFYDEGGTFDERRYARLVGARNHHEVQITAGDFVACFDAMCAHVRPPYQGPGAFGQYIVARYASEHCQTVLSGEGGDELFGGYARLLAVAGEPLPDGYESYRPPADYPDDLVGALAYDWERLPDLLAVDDQMCGAWGLCAVAPFTDTRVVDFVLASRPEARIGKWMLKAAVRGVVPDEILARRDKMGMPIPLVKWAQGPLRDFVGDRIGYVPDPGVPWDRGWWYDMLRASIPETAAA